MRLSRVSHIWEVAIAYPLCQRNLWGYNDCMHHVSPSLLPGCPSLPLPALLDWPERSFELVLWTKVSLLGLVSRLYAASTAIEPLLLVLSCSHDHIVYRYVHYTTRYNSLLKIFCDKFLLVESTTKIFPKLWYFHLIKIIAHFKNPSISPQSCIMIIFRHRDA